MVQNQTDHRALIARQRKEGIIKHLPVGNQAPEAKLAAYLPKAGRPVPAAVIQKMTGKTEAPAAPAPTAPVVSEAPAPVAAPVAAPELKLAPPVPEELTEAATIPLHQVEAKKKKHSI